jgi:hypothetical protein
LRVKATGSQPSLNVVSLTVTDADGHTMQRPLHVAVSSSATAIATIDAETVELIAYDIYTTDGAKIGGGTCKATIGELPSAPCLAASTCSRPPMPTERCAPIRS